MTGALIRRGYKKRRNVDTDTERHRENAMLSVEAETEVHLQTKGHQGLPVTGKKGFSQKAFGERAWLC